MNKIKAGYIYTDIDNITDEPFKTLDIIYYAFLLTDGTMKEREE